MGEDSTRCVFGCKTGAVAGIVDHEGSRPLQQHDASSLYLLFETGQRPSAEAVHAFAAAWEKVFVSHDPAQHDSPIGNPADLAHENKAQDAEVLPLNKQWVELLRDGLTFDLQGLAPGPVCSAPAPAHRFDWPEGRNTDACEAMRLVIGPHLLGADNSIPVLRTLIALARDLVLFFEDIAAVVWPPSASLIGRRFFESTATAWLEGGPFPALGLTAFRLADDGALESVGLSLWIGQELRIEPLLAADRVAATRLGVRIINHLVMLGGLFKEERIVAPDGARLILKPAGDTSFIRVQRE